MKKINRRDYLKSMGATAGVIAAAKLDAFAQRDQSSSKKETKIDTSKIFVKPGGVSQFTLLSTESVKLAFYGLMAIWQDVAGGPCFIGIHSKASAKHEHGLMIKAFRKVNGVCEQMGTTEMVPKGATPILEIIQPDILNGVYFFQPPPTNGRMDDNDFRWVVNFEGQSWYNTKLTRNPVHDPILTVTNGLFHTIMKTKSTFRRQTADGLDVLHLGSIANYVGANIYLKPGGQVNLITPKNRFECPQAANVKYELHFISHCLKVGTQTPIECEFTPYNLTDKTERSDFYMHFNEIVLPAGKDEYLLIVAEGATGDEPPLCVEPISDESPCAAVTFAGPTGFPLFP